MKPFVQPDKRYAIRRGYCPRSDALPYDVEDSPISHQPDVYSFAAHLGRGFGCTHVIDLGCGAADKLAALHPDFHIVGIDRPEIVASCARRYPFGTWMGHDLGAGSGLHLPSDIVSRAVVVCADVIEHLQAPEQLLELMHALLEHAPVALISSPERDLVRGRDDAGPPHNPHHVREWNRDEFDALLTGCGFDVEFLGLTLNNSVDRQKRTMLAVLAGQRPPRLPAPADYRVVAIVKTFNEADVVGPMLRRLIEGGIDVYLIDNWSTDDTVRIARTFEGRGLVGLEQFPPEGRGHGTYHWRPLLARTEDVASTLRADWFIHHDADEYRESPWQGVSLRDGLYHVDRCGFNAVDFTVVNFHPVDEEFQSGDDAVSRLTHWDFGERRGHFQQVKAWKATDEPVHLVDSGGHLATFPGRRIFPYKFLLRHYSFRSQTQAVRKVHDERAVHPTEYGLMNGHYALLREQRSFVRGADELPVFDGTFYSDYLVERLSGIGIIPPASSATSGPQAGLCTTPNQHARPAGLTLTPSSATFTGYQDFVLTRHGLHVMPIDASLARKHDLLKPVLVPSLVAGRTVLDLGGNSAFFSFLALQQGASAATAVDVDAAYVANVERAGRALGFEIAATHANVSDWREPADVVVALALVHWLYNCTAAFGTLEAVVAHLAGLARHALLVEWVEPDDPMVTFFGHLEWTGRAPGGPYTRETFERELAVHFARVDAVGDVSATRRLYLARKRTSVVDLGCPLPLLHPADTVISCSRLTTHRGVEYWSRVYDLGDRIEKQTSGQLALREARVLQRLDVASVPRVIATTEASDASTITLEKIDGMPFDAAVSALVTSAAAFDRFLDGCLDVLAALHDADVTHRDIHRDNVLVRDGQPVLLDFGWATAPGLPVFTPEGFAPRLNSSDVHATGVLLQDVCRKAGRTSPLVTMMANDDPEFRIDDSHLLRALADLLNMEEAEAAEGVADTTILGARSIAMHLLEQVARRDRSMDALRRRVTELEQQTATQHGTLVATERALADAERTVALGVTPDDIAAFHLRLATSLIRASDEPLGLEIIAALRPHAVAYASALRAAGQPRQALTLVSEVLRTTPPDEDVQGWLVATYMAGSLAVELGHHDEALDTFAGILALDPARVSPGFRGGALYHSGIVLKARGSRNAARDHLTRCLEVLPTHEAARAALASLDG